MKKLIIASLVFLIMIGGSIAEILYTTSAFDKLARFSGEATRKIDTVVALSANGSSQSDSTEPKDAATLEAEAAAKDAIARLASEWSKQRDIALMLGNHTVVKTVDEKVTSLTAQSGVGNWEDAGVSGAVLQAYFIDLKDDNHITFSNLF